jgi:HK97 family phage major capsid protein
MVSRLLPEAHQDNSTVWVASPTTKTQLMALSLIVGTAGSASPLYRFKTSNDDFDRLAGFPVIYSEHCSQLGTEGDLILAQLSRYLITMRAIKKQVSSHWKFTSDQSAFKMVLRADGQVDLPKAITPYIGDDTLSAVITLADRS